MSVAVQNPTAHTLLAAAVCHYQRHDFSSMRRECDDAAKLIGDVAAADRTAVECLIGTLRIAHSRIVNPADTEVAATEQLECAGGRGRSAAPDGRAPSGDRNEQPCGRPSLGRPPRRGGIESACGAGTVSGTGHRPDRTQRARSPGAPRRDPWTSASGGAACRSCVGPCRSTRMDGGAAGPWAARGHRHGQPGTGTVQHSRAAGATDGLADGGADTDVACRLVLAIACVDHATAQRDGILADEAVMRLESIQVQAGRLPPLLAGWCTAAHAAADLAAGRWSGAIDRVRAADPGRRTRTRSGSDCGGQGATAARPAPAGDRCAASTAARGSPLPGARGRGPDPCRRRGGSDASGRGRPDRDDGGHRPGP